MLVLTGGVGPYVRETNKSRYDMSKTCHHTVGEGLAPPVLRFRRALASHFPAGQWNICLSGVVEAGKTWYNLL